MTRQLDPDAPVRPGRSGCPMGLDRLLRWAAENQSRHEQLIRTRSRAARGAGISLTPTEAAILDSAPERLLRDMVTQLAAPQLPRRQFLHHAAAVSVAALSTGLAAQAALGCARRSDSAPGSHRMPEGGTAIGEPSEEAPQQRAEPGAQLRGPRVMPEGGTGTRPYRIRGPRVMPDPHLARREALAQSNDLAELLDLPPDGGSPGQDDD